MTIYEIDDTMRQMMQAMADAVDEETGEIDPEYLMKLDALKLERSQKIEGAISIYKNIGGDVDGLKNEIDQLTKRLKSAKGEQERLKNYIIYALAGETYKSNRHKVSYRKSTEVVCDDFASVPKDYLRFKDPELDKTAIKAAIKDGEIISGVHIEDKQNIQIK